MQVHNPRMAGNIDCIFLFIFFKVDVSTFTSPIDLWTTVLKASLTFLLLHFVFLDPEMIIFGKEGGAGKE